MAFGRWINGSNITNWTAYEALTASDLNDTVDEAYAPIGSIISFVKSLTGVPALPTGGWVECNGQTISDADSPLNGTTLPNLNASGGGTQYFLRGATTSGGTGGSTTHTHLLSLSSSTAQPGAISNTTNSITSSTDDHTPPYYSVVYLMRIK